jgi:prepilin-type N-terminal cleavage/methylation domain-containing protein
VRLLGGSTRKLEPLRRGADHSGVTSRRNKNQSGFTLIELLIVVALMGILGGVAVMGMGGLGDQAQRSACATEERALRSATEAHFALTGSYTDEAGLVTEGFIDEPSVLHDVTLTGLDYEIVPVGDCVGIDGSELAEGDPADPAPAEEQKAEEQKAEDEKAAQRKAEEEKLAQEQAEAELTPDQKAEAEKVAQQKAEAEKAAQEAAQATPSEQMPRLSTGLRSNVPTACTKDQIDINIADRKDLIRIIHVGNDEASHIIKQRPFSSLKELQQVKGLSEGEVAEIMKQGLACAAG